MKNRFLKILATLLAVILVATVLVSCGKKAEGESSPSSSSVEEKSTTVTSVQTTTGTKTSATHTQPSKTNTEQTVPSGAGSTGNASENMNGTKTTASTNVPPVSGAACRYGVSNGQWGQFSEYVYNERGQLVSVTAISPASLAPLCYERIKNDRVYIYGKDGALTRVWLNGGVVIDVTCSADGLAATGSGTQDGITYNAKLTFSSQKILLKEEYTWPGDSLVNEYDASGNIIKITQGTRFVTTHTYSKDKISATLHRESGEKVSDMRLVMDGTRLTEIVLGDESVKLTYQNGLCVGGSYGGQTITVKHDDNKRVISTKITGDIPTTETFTYNANSQISQYTRERTAESGKSWSREVVTCTYTYAQDGTISKFSYVLVEYDEAGNESYRREVGY